MRIQAVLQENEKVPPCQLPLYTQVLESRCRLASAPWRASVFTLHSRRERQSQCNLLYRIQDRPLCKPTLGCGPDILSCFVPDTFLKAVKSITILGGKRENKRIYYSNQALQNNCSLTHPVCSYNRDHKDLLHHSVILQAHAKGKSPMCLHWLTTP